MTYAELGIILEQLGLPVVLPGGSGDALPAIVVQPDGMAPEAGFSWLYDECEIRVLYPLAQNNPAQFELAHGMAAQVWHLLWGTNVQADEEGPVYASDQTDPPSFGYSLNVRFPGADLCDPAPEVLADPDPDPDPEEPGE